MIGSWYSNPGTRANGSAPGSGGVGKYLKSRTSEDQTAAAAAASLLQQQESTKKRKLGVSSEFKNFSSW